jgi:hypothetical protein
MEVDFTILFTRTCEVMEDMLLSVQYIQQQFFLARLSYIVISSVLQLFSSLSADEEEIISLQSNLVKLVRFTVNS